MSPGTCAQMRADDLRQRIRDGGYNNEVKAKLQRRGRRAPRRAPRPPSTPRPGKTPKEAKCNLRVATLHAGTPQGRLASVYKLCEEQGLDALALQETRMTEADRIAREHFIKKCGGQLVTSRAKYTATGKVHHDVAIIARHPLFVLEPPADVDASNVIATVVHRPCKPPLTFVCVSIDGTLPTTNKVARRVWLDGIGRWAHAVGGPIVALGDWNCREVEAPTDGALAAGALRNVREDYGLQPRMPDGGAGLRTDPMGLCCVPRLRRVLQCKHGDRAVPSRWPGHKPPSGVGQSGAASNRATTPTPSAGLGTMSGPRDVLRSRPRARSTTPIGLGRSWLTPRRPRSAPPPTAKPRTRSRPAAPLVVGSLNQQGDTTSTTAERFQSLGEKELSRHLRRVQEHVRHPHDDLARSPAHNA